MRTWLYICHGAQLALTLGLLYLVITLDRPPPPSPPPVLELDAETRGALMELAGRVSDVEASCVWLPRSERLRVADVAPAPSKGGGSR